MKTFILIISLIIASTAIQAQSYQISFSGSGSSSTVDSVYVQNLTQNTSLWLDGNDTLMLMVSTGIMENGTASARMNLFPNPASEDVFVRFYTPNSGQALITVYSCDGRRMAEMPVAVLAGTSVFRISGLATGLYFVHCATPDISLSQKLIVYGNNGGMVEISRSDFNVNSAFIVNEKSGKNLVQMPYNQGDVVLLEGYSGNYAEVLTFTPNSSATVDFNFIPCTDADGNDYPVVTIGNQIWMGANLRTTKYSNNNDIATETDDVTWGNLTTAAYCWHSNDSLVNGKLYGALYNFEAVNTGLLCPTGWHVPTQAEWDTLFNFLGGISLAGGKLRETGTQHWTAPNSGATNVSGFTALPGSSRYGSYNNGAFPATIGTQALWWTSTEITGTNAWYNTTNNTNGGASGGPISKQYGMSVRCIKN